VIYLFSNFQYRQIKRLLALVRRSV